MRKFIKIFNFVLLISFVVFCSVFCFNNNSSFSLIKGESNSLNLYQVWHIESFEGGSYSRFQYLKNLALKYEKLFPNQLFLIKLVKEQDLSILLEESKPDLISFSEQTAKTILPYLQNLEEGFEVQENFLKSATFNNQLKCLPYIASGYCYFSKNDGDSLNLFTANSNLHSATPILKNESVNENQTLTSYECYSHFINNKNSKLLGTARDLYRLTHLQELGRINFNCKPITQFSDLIQYIGVITACEQTHNFIKFVINNENQTSLSKIGLFSTKNLKLYTDTNYSSLEQAIKQCFVPNIFN